jgi:predicted enzyme related to lactoylglutathione lyase
MKPVPPPGVARCDGRRVRPHARQRVNWNELASPDLASSKAFYSRHFGFEFNEAMNMGRWGTTASSTTMASAWCDYAAAGRAAAAAWLLYFGVPSIGRVKARHRGEGGKVLLGPQKCRPASGSWLRRIPLARDSG